MNRLTFLKRLIGGAVVSPVVAKALAAEKPALGAFHVVGIGSMSCATGNILAEERRIGGEFIKVLDERGGTYYWAFSPDTE